jgi:predicted nucleotidyltransferase
MFNVAWRTNYLVLTGSHSYGMATSSSDVDVKGYCIKPKEYFYSHHLKFEQTEEKFMPNEFPYKQYFSLNGRQRWHELKSAKMIPDEPVDCTVFDIVKFVSLATKCNPNIIELLFVNEEDILIMDKFGEKLRKNRDLFLSARARFSYTGYAFSQLKRIKTHRKWLIDPPQARPERVAYGLPMSCVIPVEQKDAANKVITKQVRLWLLEEAEVDKTIIDHIQDDLTEMYNFMNIKELENKTRLAAGKKLGFDDNFIHMLQTERRYKQDLNTWNQFKDWEIKRNPVRAELERKHGYDTKHGSHLVRLLIQGEDVLTKGTLTLKDKDQAELLTSIRAGAWSYDELIEYAEERQAYLDNIYKKKTYVVPKKPNIKKIDELLIEILEATL